jgi:hypothetical protein
MMMMMIMITQCLHVLQKLGCYWNMNKNVRLGHKKWKCETHSGMHRILAFSDVNDFTISQTHQ